MTIPSTDVFDLTEDEEPMCPTLSIRQRKRLCPEVIEVLDSPNALLQGKVGDKPRCRKLTGQHCWLAWTVMTLCRNKIQLRASEYCLLSISV